MNPMGPETRFVHESPEQDINRPKRLRVVAACDSCRSRKVKCEKRDNDQCQACYEARLACTSFDKERYYAEKGRPARRASNSSGHSQHSSHHSSRASHSSSSSNSRKHSPGHSSSSASSGHSPQQSVSPTLRMDVPCGMTADAQQYELSQVGASYSANQTYHYSVDAYYSNPTAPQDTYGSASSTYYANGNGATPTGYAAPATSQPTQTAYTPLFDPRITTNPHPSLMLPLLRAFFGYLSTNNAFISYNDVVQRFNAGQLSPVLANAIAAAAVPYTDGLQQATGHDAAAIAQAYSANAKTILEKRRNDSSLSTLHAAILIAWSETEMTNEAGFRYYSTLALEMAQRLRIDDDAIRLALAGGSQTQLTRLRAAWASIAGMFPSGSFSA